MAESQAVLTVFNWALGHVGNPAVATPDESPECQLFYPDARDTMLSWAPWTFATTRRSLTRLDDAPASDFTYQFALPTIPYPLRLLNIDTQGFRYKREVYSPVSTPTVLTPVLLSDADSIVVKYIARVSEAVWHPLFTSTVALFLAVRITQRLTGKAQLRGQLFTEFLAQLQQCMDVDGHQDSPDAMVLNKSYLAARVSDALPELEDFSEAFTPPF